MTTAVLTRTLDEELEALVSGEAHECLVCGDEAKVMGERVECRSCGSIIERGKEAIAAEQPLPLF